VEERLLRLVAFVLDHTVPCRVATPDPQVRSLMLQTAGRASRWSESGHREKMPGSLRLRASHLVAGARSKDN
jgi:hypothetical protein